VKPSLDISAEEDHAFQRACENGHLEVAQWLYQIKPTLDISAEEDYAFQWACANGHLQVAQWLYQIQPTLDISAENEQAFRSACGRGHLHVAQWLYQIKPTLDISVENDAAFRSVCIHSNLHFAQWLQSLRPDRYSLTIMGHKINYYQIIQPLHYFEETVQLFDEEDKNCPICAENRVTVQTVCKHNYCRDCLTKWLSIHKTCPYCRDPIDKVYSISNIWKK
jgi:ankyrin repeat protein